MSLHCDMCRCDTASPVPEHLDGLARADRGARSAVVRITAPPPSVRRQQSACRSGSAIMRDLQRLVDAQRLAVVEGLGIELRPPVHRHRHRRELAAGRAVLVHVTARRQGVLADQRQPVRRLELRRTAWRRRVVAQAPALRGRSAPCCRRRAAPRCTCPPQRRDGVRDEQLPRRAADLRAVDIRRTQPQILRHLQRVGPVVAAAEEAVDVVLPQPGVVERRVRRLLMQLQARSCRARSRSRIRRHRRCRCAAPRSFTTCPSTVHGSIAWDSIN